MFQTTQWSLVLAARGDTPLARDALERLCRIYRPSVLAYVRGCGYSRSDAEDLTQSFFARFLEKRVHAAAQPERGRFRTFLRTAVHNFLVNAGEYERAARRRPQRPGGEVDPDQLHAAESDRPEAAFERAFALIVIERAMRTLRRETTASGKAELFRRLRPWLLEAPEGDAYAALAAELGVRPNTLAVATFRLRQRLRELVQHELAQTVADPGDVEHEFAAVIGSLRRPSSRPG